MTGAVTVWSSGAGDTRVGTLHAHMRRGSESATFTYDPRYLQDARAYALDPQLRLSAVPHQTAAGRPLFGAMSDGAPDRWGRTLLMRRERALALEQNRQPRSLGEIDFLLGVRDDLRQGALRYQHGDGGDLAAFEASGDDGVPALTDLPALMELAGLAEREVASLPDLRRLIHAGGSLGGARPKAHVMEPGGALAIAKFPSADRDTWDVMAWERVALVLAAHAGIEVPSSRLLTLAGRSVLLVTRFDREGGLVHGRRIGYVSAMTMLEASEGEDSSYVDIAAAIEEHSDRTSDDLEQLWRRMLFNVAIGNTDDHLRNHGFVRAPDRDAWRLSPAFDLNPEPTLGDHHHATSIDGSDAPASLARVMAVASDFRLRPADAERVAAEVLSAVVRWREVAASAGISRAAVEHMAPAFAATTR